jgi:hypothetical protein
MGRVLFILACVASSAFAGTTDDAIPDARYLEYGKGFAPYTARVGGLHEDGTTPFGTCVLIHDRWALTAAHVVEGLQRGVVIASTGTRRIDRICVHQGFTNAVYLWHDIALVRVNEPFGLPRYPPIATGDVPVGATASVVGFGITGRLSTGHDTYDGELRAGTGVVARIEAGVIVLPAKRGGSPLPLCIAPGDSGGPLFVNGELAGIHSLTMKVRDGTPTKSREGEESAHTSVALYHKWIHAVMGEDVDGICKTGSCPLRSASPAIPCRSLVRE